jgi:hypothetical protein
MKVPAALAALASKDSKSMMKQNKLATVVKTTGGVARPPEQKGGRACARSASKLTKR